MGLPTPVGLPARRNALRAALRQQPSAQAAFRSAVANQLSTGNELKDEMRDAQVKGAWDDDGWAYRKRVEAWTERASDVLTGGGREDLASALAEVEPPPRPPFEALLNGHSPSYARLIGLLDARIALLEQPRRLHVTFAAPTRRRRPRGPWAPVLGDVGMLEEDDVVVRRRCGDRIPDAVQRVLEVVGLELDLEGADLVGLADGRVRRQRGGQLLARPAVARGSVVEHEHRHPLSRHPR
jgi:hypothetical protein